MLFNSVAYAIFLPIVYVLYWFACGENIKRQNLLLLFAGYFFYGCWDVRFLALLAFSTFLDYFTGLQIAAGKTAARKKLWLFISVFVNVGFLAFFKYYNFFANSAAEFLQAFGLKPNFTLLQIVLPVGISFYTFHGLSYVFDIYRGRIKPTENVVDYSLFVCFFPLLVAGPIERAQHLLPQIQAPRSFDAAKATDGLRQILWGLFKKVLIADNCAQYSSLVFNNYEHLSGGALFCGALLFMFEVYGDFSGYSDIALGSARLLGFELLQNFRYPYFSRSISEFWTRWHISLSSWFKDYVYIPLGGGREGKLKKVRNVFIVFLLSGFWHGASFNRIVWGGLHGLFMMPGILLYEPKKRSEAIAPGRLLPSLREFVAIASTFLLCALALVVFRTLSLRDAFDYLAAIARACFRGSIFKEACTFWQTSVGLTPLLLLAFFKGSEWMMRDKRYPLEDLFPGKQKTWLRFAIYFLLLTALFVFANRSRQFIYFQF